jgi:hypothetical protein
MEFGKRIENKKKQNERGEVKSRRLRTAYIPLSPCSCVCVLVCALYKEKQPFRLLSNRRGQQQPAQGRRRRVTITIWQKNKMLLRVLLSLSPIYLYSRCLGGPLLFIHFPPSTPSSLRLLLLFPLVFFSSTQRFLPSSTGSSHWLRHYLQHFPARYGIFQTQSCNKRKHNGPTSSHPGR